MLSSVNVLLVEMVLIYIIEFFKVDVQMVIYVVGLGRLLWESVNPVDD